MGLFKYLDSITPKIYILSLGIDITIAKIVYTKKEIEKRIRDYKFSGEWKGREGEIKIHAIFENPKAETIEDYAIAILNRQGVEKTNDKNLGGGYTEWYNCSPTKIQSSILLAIRYLERYKRD